jgi:ribonuclease BN (tRNA processing enzyme)
VRDGDRSVVLDIGPGAMGKLELATDYSRVDAVVVTHMHADHFFDLVPLRYGLKYGSPRAQRMSLWLPPGGTPALEALRRAVSTDAPARFFDDVFSVEEYDPNRELSFGDLRLRFARTRHFVPAFAVRVERNGASLVYSADTAPCNGVVDLARDTGIFLCEAALGLSTETGERGHTSAAEAGEMANQANVTRLVLTHYGQDEPGDGLLEAAKGQFRGPVALAEDGMDFSL